MRMRIGLPLLCLAAAAAPAPLFGQFEGVADFRMTMHGEPGHAVQSSGKMYSAHGAYRSEWELDLGARARKEGSSGTAPQKLKMTVLGKRAEPDKIFVLNDEKKTYSVMDLKSIREAGKDQTKQTYTVQKGGTDTVAGIACQKATVTSAKGDVFDVCVSREWGSSNDWISAMTRNRGSGSWFAALRENGIEGFPVRFAIRAKAGAEPSMVWELTHVERKSLPASLFEVPPGYQQADSAMGGMTPEQEKQVNDARAQMNEALKNMTPEQRKAYEDAMKKYGQPTPRP